MLCYFFLVKASVDRCKPYEVSMFTVQYISHDGSSGFLHESHDEISWRETKKKPLSSTLDIPKGISPIGLKVWDVVRVSLGGPDEVQVNVPG